MPTNRTTAAIVGLGLMAMLTGGCVSSQASRYERQFSSAIKPQGSANEAVALSFGLASSAPPRIAVGAMGDRKTRVSRDLQRLQ